MGNMNWENSKVSAVIYAPRHIVDVWSDDDDTNKLPVVPFAERMTMGWATRVAGAVTGLALAAMTLTGASSAGLLPPGGDGASSLPIPARQLSQVCDSIVAPSDDVADDPDVSDAWAKLQTLVAKDCQGGVLDQVNADDQSGASDAATQAINELLAQQQVLDVAVTVASGMATFQALKQQVDLLIDQAQEVLSSTKTVSAATTALKNQLRLCVAASDSMLDTANLTANTDTLKGCQASLPGMIAAALAPPATQAPTSAPTVSPTTKATTATSSTKTSTTATTTSTRPTATTTTTPPTTTTTTTTRYTPSTTTSTTWYTPPTTPTTTTTTSTTTTSTPPTTPPTSTTTSTTPPTSTTTTTPTTTPPTSTTTTTTTPPTTTETTTETHTQPPENGD